MDRYIFYPVVFQTWRMSRFSSFFVSSFFGYIAQLLFLSSLDSRNEFDSLWRSLQLIFKNTFQNGATHSSIFFWCVSVCVSPFENGIRWFYDFGKNCQTHSQHRHFINIYNIFIISVFLFSLFRQMQFMWMGCLHWSYSTGGSIGLVFLSTFEINPSISVQEMRAIPCSWLRTTQFSRHSYNRNSLLDTWMLKRYTWILPSASRTHNNFIYLKSFIHEHSSYLSIFNFIKFVFFFFCACFSIIEWNEFSSLNVHTGLWTHKILWIWRNALELWP